MEADVFNFTLPMDLIKSRKDEMRIGGYASTSSQDRDGDEIAMKGLDVSMFLNYGFFNFEHQKDIILGYPDKYRCHFDRKGFYVEGTLIKGIPMAENIYNTAIALAKANAPRKLGFSVEGRILEREDGTDRIIKAQVVNVAITSSPVNATCTWDALVKAMDMSDISKPMDTGAIDPITPESLESAFHTLSYIIGEDEAPVQNLGMLKAALAKKNNLTKPELTLYFQLTKGLSSSESASLVNKLVG